MELKNISKIYGIKKALDNINIELKETGLVFILGASGSGKTTLLNLIGGIDTPTSGNIIIDNIDITTLDNTKLDEYRFNNIGFVFQDFNLLNELTVKENITLIFKMRKIKYTEDKLKRCFEIVDLDYNEFKDKKVYKCSGGERQKIAILRALAKDPKILLCDEPTGSLDSMTSELIFENLKKLAKRRLIIVVSHDEDLANKYADRIVNLEDGKITSDILINHKDKFNSKIKFKKNKIPFKHMLKIGLSNYIHHPIRTFLTFLFLIISITLFSITFNLSALNKKDMLDNYAETTNIPIVVINKVKYEIDRSNTVFNGSIETLFTNYYTETSMPITKDDFNNLNNISNNLLISFAEGGVFYYIKGYNSFYHLDELIKFPQADYYSPSGYAFTDYEKLNQKVDIIGRYPKEDNEILINNKYFELFKNFSYRDIETGLEIKINNYDDLLNKNIITSIYNHNIMKVVGIYNGDNIEIEYKDNSTLKHDFYNTAFVTENCFYNATNTNDAGYNTYLLQPNANDLKNLINQNIDLKTNDEAYIQYNIRDEAKGFITIENIFYGISFFKNFFNVIGIIFSLISILLLYNTFSNFIFKQKRQIGILKTLGVNKTSINIIYISIAFLEALIVVIISSLLCLFLTPTLNSLLYNKSNINIIQPNFIIFLLVLLLTILIILLSLIIPLIKLNKKTPIQIINEGKRK